MKETPVPDDGQPGVGIASPPPLQIPLPAIFTLAVKRRPKVTARMSTTLSASKAA